VLDRLYGKFQQRKHKLFPLLCVALKHSSIKDW
jgi:hypothetical protein